MSRIELNDGLKTSHTDIDHDHQVLVDLINQLHDAMESGQDKEICGKTIAELLNYAITHFSMEERLMVTHRYSNIAAHKAQHAKFLKTVLDFKTESDLKWNIGSSVHDFLGNWLIEHILRFDKELAAEMFKLAPKTPDNLDTKIASHIIRDKLSHK